MNSEDTSPAQPGEAGDAPGWPSNWGVFGDDDEIGTLNYLTPEAVMGGVAEVRHGERYPLNLPLDLPDHKAVRRIAEISLADPYRKRPIYVKTVLGGGRTDRRVLASDDQLSFSLQGSTQWDSFVHVGMEERGSPGVFYNGRGADAIDDSGFAHCNGIDKVAEVGIVGRGVLVDVARMVTGGDAPLALDVVITPEMTARCLELQGTDIRRGDIVCIRTGWTDLFQQARPEERPALFARVPGIHPDHVWMAHRQCWSAVAADNVGVEFMPFEAPEISAHVLMMRNLGLPFGELFDFSGLHKACLEHDQWSFLFMSSPLRVPGGVGSPGNAIAVL
jgi:kynurenine formamidase